VEDEIDALAKEHLSADVKALQLASNEPPFRGTIDQHPVILESTISTVDAAKLHDKLHAECQAEDSGERRFVLIPRGDTHSPIRDDEEVPWRSYTAATDKPTQNDTGKRNLGKPEGSAPPLERRRSRQDLPSLQTEVPPPYRRSTSAYAYTPIPKQSTRSPRASGDSLLSPDAASFRSQSKGGYFDLPPKNGPRLSQGNIATPVAEKRRSAGSTSTPTTPLLDKRNSTGSDTYPRVKQDLGDKLTRPQHLSTESGVRRSDRAPSAHSHLDPLEHAGHRKGSSQSSSKYYSDSDDDQDSSDSDRRRRRHHHHRHHPQNSLRPDDDRDRHHRSGSKSTRSSDGKPGSRISSPLASPNISPSQLPPTEVSRNTTHSSNRDSRRPSSRPVSPLSGYPEAPNDSGRSRARSPVRSRRSSPVAAPGTRNTSSTLPIPIPARVDLYSPGETRHSPSFSQYEDDHRRASTRPTPSPKPSPKPSSWQPPSFQPPSESTHLERPVGSYRRYSQDVDDGNIAPLPPCPRTTLSRGYNDWLTLPRCPAFNICPSCYESTMAPTEFHQLFVPAPAKPPHEEVLCDFGSQPWYRIAWLLTRKEHRRDLTLMSSLANIADTIPPCMGKYEAVRKWYSIIDPDTGYPIRNFDVCLACVKSIETLLPSLKGVFVRTDNKYPPDLPRVCDMRFDSKRFIHYFDALETAADTASNSRYPPDTTDLASLVKRFASLPECSRDKTLSNAHWYIITQLPDFTVCPECFDEVVLPGLEKKKAIPAMFNKAMQRKEAASCQLYSERMRGIFEKAVDGNDYKFLAAKARERRAKEGQRKKDVAEWKGVKGGEKEIKRIEGEWAKWE